MTELQKELQALEEKRADLAGRLRERLGELDEERAEIADQLKQLEPSGRHTNGVSTRPATVRSTLGKTVIQVVQESGEKGLISGEIVSAVRGEYDDKSAPEKGAIVTHISRLTKRGLLRAEGEMGYQRYFAPAAAADGAEA